MIEEQAQVVEIKEGQLILQAQTQSSCGSCEASKGCGTSLLAKVVGRKFTHFQVENNINAKVGDTVIVGIAEDALLKGSMMIYILPVFGMLLFAVLADYFFLSSEHYHDLIVAGCAVIGMGTGALISKWYFQRQSSAQLFSPVVLRKIIDHGKL